MLAFSLASSSLEVDVDDEAESVPGGDSEASEPLFGGAGRFVRAFASLLGVHVDHARDEAAADARRLGSALLAGVFAVILAAVGVVFLHLAAFAELRSRFVLTSSETFAILAGIDFAASAFFAMRARGKLATPVLVRTRALLRRTVASLTES